MLKILIRTGNHFRLSSFNKKISVDNFVRVSRLSTGTSNEPNIEPKPIIESKTTSQVESASDDDEFRTIYRNSNMKLFAMINKLNPNFIKSCSVVLPPVSGILYWVEFLDNKSLLGFYLIAVSVILPLQVLSFATQRLIGFIYLNKENDQVKISFITYFGRREDIILPIESIMSFSDSPVTALDYFYKKVRTFDTNTVYKIDLKFGEIVDEDAFKLVFGDYKK